VRPGSLDDRRDVTILGVFHDAVDVKRRY